MTNVRYHTFRLQDLFVSCPNIFIKQKYSVFLSRKCFVWLLVPIIYILSPTPFVFVSILYLWRVKKTAEITRNMASLQFFIHRCIPLTSVVPAPNFSACKTIMLFHYGQFTKAHFYTGWQRSGTQIGEETNDMYVCVRILSLNEGKTMSRVSTLKFFDPGLTDKKWPALVSNNIKAKRSWKHKETMVVLHILVGGGWFLSRQWTKGGSTRCSTVSLVLHLQCFLIYNSNCIFL